MTIQDIGLFQALGAKMDFLNQRQGIISQNVANSDTPGYRPKDLVPVDFADLVKNSAMPSNNKVSDVHLIGTNESHIGAGADQIDPKSRKQRETYEVAPAGNAVVLEEQLINAGQNSMDYNMMLNVYQKQVGMLRTALGNR